MDESSFYSRQVLLSQVGPDGQKRLTNAKCLIIGAGGLGAPALMYLAAAGVGTIGICDGDKLDISNLHRQPLYTSNDIGEFKAKLAEKRLKELNPFIDVISYLYHLTAKNATELFSNYDLVLDCTDNFVAKFLINDAGYLLKKPIVRASIYQFEGQIQTYIPQRKDSCLRCLWQEAPEEGCVGSCQQVGVLGTVPGFFGVLQATEAIKFFLKMQTLKSNEILFMDLIDFTQSRISHAPDKSCPLCGDNPTITTLSDKNDWEIELSVVKNQTYQVVDIREPWEVSSDPYLKDCKNMPVSTFDETNLDADEKYAFFCQRGRRSLNLVKRLRKNGHQNTFSLIGGVEKFRS